MWTDKKFLRLGGAPGNFLGGDVLYIDSGLDNSDPLDGWVVDDFQNSIDGILKTDGFRTSLVGPVVKIPCFQGRARVQSLDREPRSQRHSECQKKKKLMMISL